MFFSTPFHILICVSDCLGFVKERVGYVLSLTSSICVGDIWSQGGIAIFGILVYWIDNDFKLRERLVAAIPFSSVRHTGPELEAATKLACASMGIGEYKQLKDADGDWLAEMEDTVCDSVHCTVSDNASNIVNGWLCFDGHECVAHTLALIVKAFLEQPRVKKVFAKLRGMTGHFNHSVIGVKLLYEILKRNGLAKSKPPQDNDTRSGWGGAFKQAKWYHQNKVAVKMYDIEHPTKTANAVPNLDGSVYKDHQLTNDEWEILRESLYILNHPTILVDLLQGAHYPTASLVLPLIGKLAHIADEATSLKYEGKPVTVVLPDVVDARKKLLKGVTDRYFTDLMDCKVEDFSVATILDPRYKSFKFKCANKWMRGNLTREKAVAWTRKAYDSDWKPKPKPVESTDSNPSQKKVKHNVVTVASYLADSDDEEFDTVASEGEVEKDELSIYLSLPDVPLDTYLLKWWKSQEVELPSLSRMARQFLGVPATTAGVERAFSKVTFMHSDLRKRLSEGSIEHSIMASMNTAEFD
ncbi:hypothetical protein CYMTET_4253 [Cymbomonas tetramitiformis]|uniref:HAT C-terminal dimerisation domain-containing protein n=1 Tax=Cymbomonas tetramitiformis TaxID=36881 RepID=A0AAE0H1P7_9CHLO|nr:hypothetical protein CYMTET_4253 [Cymbomonas tetramitiformis]